MLWWILISNKMTLIITISTAENIQAIIMVMVMMVKSDRSEVSRHLVCSLKMSHWAWVGGRFEEASKKATTATCDRNIEWSLREAFKYYFADFFRKGGATHANFFLRKGGYPHLALFDTF